MCDFGSIFSGEDLGSIGSIFGDLDTALTEADNAKQNKKIAQQTLESSKLAIQQKMIVQSRAQGVRRAAYGKAGVTLKGSARTLLDEQAKQDELDLLTDRYNAQLKFNEQIDKGSAATKKSNTALSTGLIKAADFGSNYDFGKITKGFGLGA